MNVSNVNLFHTLFNDLDEESSHSSDDNDLGIINSMYGSLNFNDICKYHDLNSYKSTIPSNCNDYINVLHINARSLNKNFDLVIALIKSLPKLPHFLSISETWLNSSNEHLHEMDGFNAYYVHRPEGSIGGGVAIYVKNNLQSTKIDDFCI